MIAERISRKPATRVPMAEGLAARIEADIVQRGWPIGEVLGSEDQLMARYDVGRAVVREAVRILESHGVAHRRPGPGGGLVVTEPEPATIMDATRLYLDWRNARSRHLYRTWFALELEAVRELATTIDDAGIIRLRAVLAEQNAYDDAGHSDLSVRPSLHLEIARLSGNPLLELFLQTVMRLCQPDGYDAVRNETAQWVRVRKEEIIEAIASGDAALAENRVRRYLEKAMHFDDESGMNQVETG